MLAAPDLARASGPIDDSAFEAPPYQVEPALSVFGIERGLSIAHVDLSYRKGDGREIGGWKADLYLTDVSGKAPLVPVGSAQGGSDVATARAGPASRSAGEHERRPLIVVLPVGGAGKDGGEAFARAFAKDGFAALYLHRPSAEAEGVVLHSLKGTSKSLTEDVVNLRRAIAWATRLPLVDSRRIGVLGVSRGAIVTALAAQLDARLSTVLVLGGADLPGLFRDSRLERVKRMRRKETDRARGDLEAVAERAASLLANVDPAERPGRLDPARTLLINARYDRVIPASQALALRAAAGGATQAWLPSGHYTSLLFTRRIRTLARAHFRRTLG